MGEKLQVPAGQSPTHVRFGVLGFVCSLSLLTYLDRVCIARVSRDIRYDLCLTNEQMGLVFSAFLLGYALFEVPGGWMGDRWGSRRVLIRIVLWWSAFTALTGCIWPSALGPMLPFSLMLAVRFLFGCGEAGAYPNIARVVGAWFPFKERGLAQGANWMSARLGGAVAPLVIGALSAWLGWREAFWIFGMVGLVWCFFFALRFYNTPEEDPRVNEAERGQIRAGPYSWQPAQATAGHGRIPWRQFARSLSLWALCTAGFGVSFAWYFYPTWQPQFLEDQFGISFEDSGILTGLPFLCGAVGCLLGGGLSDWFIHRTGSRRWGRSLIGIVGFSGAGLCVLATGFVAEAWQAVALLCLAFFINDLAIPPIWATCTDIGGKNAGALAGVVNTAGAIGGLLSPIMAPVLRARNYPWSTVFTILAIAWFASAAAWLFIDASKPIAADPD